MNKFFQFGWVILLLAQSTFAKNHQLVLNWKPEPQFGGFYAAKVEGTYQKHSIPLDIVAGGAGTPTIQAVAAGSAEFGIVGADELLVSREHGSDVVALFATFQTSPQPIIAHAEKGYRSIADIFASNSTLAVQKGLPYYLFLEKKLGKPKAKIVPTLGDVTYFLTRSDFAQQAYTPSEPVLLARRNVKVTNFPIAGEGFNPYMTVLVARKSFVDKNPDVARKMVAAVKEGWKSYLSDPAKTNTFMHQLNPSMDPQTFQESAIAQKPLIENPVTKAQGLGTMTEDRWKTLAEQLVGIGLLRKMPEVGAVFVNL